MQKGDLFIQRSNRKIFEMVGRWEGTLYLVPLDSDDDRVLIYTAYELEQLISKGHFSKLYKTGIKVNSTAEEGEVR